MAKHQSWPTPRANDSDKRGNVDTENPRNGLVGAVQKFPTPTCHDRKGKSSAVRGKNAQGGQTLTESVGGSLNPNWVEWLMGWPIGWTDLKKIIPRADTWEHEPEDIPRTTTEKTSRADRLKAIGNGQVPQCAAAAWRILTTLVQENEIN